MTFSPIDSNTQLIEVSGLSGNYEIKLTEAEVEYYATMNKIGELACVGAGLGGDFDNANELLCSVRL